MAARAGSSQPIDGVDLSSSISLLLEPSMSASATTDITTDFSTPISIRVTNDKSGARIEAPHIDTA